MNLLRCCRGSIDDKSTLMDREAVEKLLRQIPESLMDQNCDNFYREKNKEGSIDENLLRNYREAIEFEENEFFKERKNT